MLTPTQPYSKALGDGLILRSLAGAEDVERLAAFNQRIHEDEGVAVLTRNLLFDHPHTRPEHWLLVEEAGGRIVSSLCLIPWTWRYQDVPLQSGEMAIVGTLEEYRRRGLIRVQAARFAELLRDGGYDVSHIQGIGYFYRQFGYEYAIPLEAWWRVDLHLMPGAPPNAPGPHTFRRAKRDDLPLLMRLYDRAGGDLHVATLRDEATWHFLLGPAAQSGFGAETWLVLEGEGWPVGYFRIPNQGFGEGLIVGEVSWLDNRAALAVLCHCKVLAQERNKPYIRLNLPDTASLVQIARHLGAHNQGHYAWQIRLVDVGNLLRKLAPVLERRIAASPLAGLTRTFCLNLYREAFDLRFQEGRLAAIEPLGFVDDRADLRLPPLLAAPLILGYRSREELAGAYHDIFAGGEANYLVDILFPKVPSFLYTVY
jgi:hypothetical protein